MNLRALAWGALRASPAIAGAIALGLFGARELGMVLPDSVAMGLAMFPAGYVAGLAARVVTRGRCPRRS
jgi:hypothetical protein